MHIPFLPTEEQVIRLGDEIRQNIFMNNNTKQKLIEEFREKFNRIVPVQNGFIVGKKSGIYDNCAFALEDIESFLSQAFDCIQAEMMEEVMKCVPECNCIVCEHNKKRQDLEALFKNK